MSIRHDQIYREIQDIFKYNTVLMIGLKERGAFFLRKFVENNYTVDVVEVFGPNVMWLKTQKELPIRIVWQKDITKFDTLDRRWDIVFWWHGPEHISKQHLAPTLSKLEAATNKLVIIGCPWGIYEQPPIEGNPHEEHRNHIETNDLESIGYLTHTLGERNKESGHILAYKRLSG